MASAAVLAVLVLAVQAAPAHAAFPGQNGKIALERWAGAPLSGDLWTVNPDGSGATQLTTGTANDLEPAWSPDGSKIAFVSNRDGNFEIYTMNANGTAVTRLTNDAAKDLDPAWSPDGVKIVFSSTRDMLEGDLYAMNAADGTGVTRLTFSVERDGYFEAAVQPTWSPDASTIAYTKQLLVGIANPTEIWSMNADGSNQHGLDPHPYSDPPADEEIFYDGFPDWSPDQNKIAFYSSRNPTPGIFTMSSTGSGITQVATYQAAPAWSPDGTKIAYGSSGGIHIVNPDGTGETMLLSGSTNNPDWQPILKGYPRPRSRPPPTSTRWSRRMRPAPRRPRSTPHRWTWAPAPPPRPLLN